MTSQPQDLMMQAWKQQLDTGLRVIETILEGATRIRETQLEAASFAHADIEATRKAIVAATDPSQLLKLQTEWARANLEKSLAYWRAMYQNVMETNAELAKCVSAGALIAAPQSVKGPDLDAFRQWFDSVQQFYKPIEKAGA